MATWSGFLILCLFFVSDKIFGNTSLGKRIFRIKLINADGGNKISFAKLVQRRFMELLVNPLFVRSYEEVINNINQKTNSKIVLVPKRLK